MYLGLYIQIYVFECLRAIFNICIYIYTYSTHTSIDPCTHPLIAFLSANSTTPITGPGEDARGAHEEVRRGRSPGAGQRAQAPHEGPDCRGSMGVELGAASNRWLICHGE